MVQSVPPQTGTAKSCFFILCAVWATALLPAQIHAEKSPFLVERLKVWMLPTLALIRKEKTVDYVVGFDDLGGKDDFTTQACPVVVRTRH